MNGITHSHASSVMQAYPGCPPRRIHQSIQYGPIRNRIRTVQHALRFPVWRSYRTCVQMIPSYDQRGGDLTTSHQFVKGQGCLLTFPLTQPTDPRRQSLESNPLLGHIEPTFKPLILREQIQKQTIGNLNILGITRKGHPTERPLALAKQRPYIRRHKTRKIKRLGITSLQSPAPKVIPIIERDGPLGLKFNHQFHMPAHGRIG